MGFALGSVIWVLALAALVRAIARRISRGPLGPMTIAGSYLLAWPISIPFVAYGFADGGQVDWVFAATAYLPTALMGFWVALTNLPVWTGLRPS
jgi:hypothetical protein